MNYLKLTNNQIEDLKKKHYGISLNHSAVQICEWTKKSLRDEGECYKRIFYGVETFSCAQMTPVAMWCDQNCIFCWRPAENMLKTSITENVDDPEDIIKSVLEEKYILLTGFKGLESANAEKVRIAMEEFPSHWAISLSGEPTLYPKLDKLIRELKSHKEVKSVFLVTNGQNPQVLEELNKTNSLPTQLYISLDASNLEQYRTINRGIRVDGWKRLNTTLKMLGSLTNTRTVIRLTIIKGLNDDGESLGRFVKIIEDSQPDFIEVKSYMHIGYSRKRLSRENMPTTAEIEEYANRLVKKLPSYKYEDHQPQSRIVLLANTAKSKDVRKSRWIIEPKDWRCR